MTGIFLAFRSRLSKAMHSAMGRVWLLDASTELSLHVSGQQSFDDNVVQFGLQLLKASVPSVRVHTIGEQDHVKIQLRVDP
jgi:hypothetical protein